MRNLGFLFMLLLNGAAASLYLSFPSKGKTIVNPGIVSIGSMNVMALTTKRRKVEQGIDHPSKVADVEGSSHLEDYCPIDPIPSSTTSIRHGPIQHGTPLMPYIPEPSPPPSETKHENHKSHLYAACRGGRKNQIL
ncbi:uncharacterized protein LOC121802331 isoform X2 [Salvia splendens]|uniref:uncharacterized protein LOC121802331 isoform X2 n=1 Tax=Salvia splendens TaxID=180675 RepID=UPI001C25835A|nr:uncharacterized protein LOC121802331 isoform X2 [Salvia splendens]